MTHDLVVVTADFWSTCSLEESYVSPIHLDPTPTQRGGVHPIVHGWLVQLDKGVRIQPVAAGAVPPIDDDDLGVGMLNQGVDEPHPECACTDHEVVGLHVHPRLSQKRSIRIPATMAWAFGNPFLAIESSKQGTLRRTLWIDGPNQDHGHSRAARAGRPRPASGSRGRCIHNPPSVIR